MKKLVLLLICLLLPAAALAEADNSCEDTQSTGNRLVKDGWIYQVMGLTDESAPDAPAYRIARAPLNAPADWQTVFGPATHYIGFLCDLGDVIAFADNTHAILYAMSPDGGDVRTLYASATPVEAMLSCGSAVYFCNFDGLFRLDEAGNLSTIYEAKHRMARYFARVGDELIFSETSPDGTAPSDEIGLFSIRADGSDLRQLIEGEPASFTIHDDVLYTALNGETVALDLATGEQCTVCEQAFTFRQQLDGCYSVGEQAADGYHLRLYVSEDGAFHPDAMRIIELNDCQFLLNGCMAFINDDESLSLMALADWLAAQ